MSEINVASIESEVSKKYSYRELYAMVCYYYPQYNLKQASRLPARDVNLLLRTASKIDAANNLNLTHIAAAPQSEGGVGVTNLISHFKKIIEE